MYIALRKVRCYVSYVPTAVTRHLTKTTSGRKGLFGVTDEGTAHHGGEGTVVGA